MSSDTEKPSSEKDRALSQEKSDALIAMAIKRRRLEQRVANQEQIITRNQATIVDLQELIRTQTAWADVYNADIKALTMEIDDLCISTAALQSELQDLEKERNTQEKDYDDANREEKAEECSRLVREARRRIEQDTIVVEQLEREASRLRRWS